LTDAAPGSSPHAALFDAAFMAKLEQLELIARKVFASSTRGDRRSRRLGGGLEFADHRRYSPGDDFRNIDWNVYARLGKLLIRLFEEEEDLHVYVLVDTSGSMSAADGAKLVLARRLAAALCWLTVAGLDRVDVGGFGASFDAQLTPARGRGQAFRCFARLAALAPSGVTSLGDAMTTFANRHRHRGLVFVLSDLFAADGWQRGLDVLRHHRFEPVVVHLTDPRDHSPDMAAGDVTLVDSETGERRDITLTPRLLARLKDTWTAFHADVMAGCKARAIPYVEARVGEDFDAIILGMMRQGGILA
jgi:uncharacterized protein (DUF58 family)